MKSLVTVLLCAMLFDLAASSAQEKYSQVRIFATHESDFRRMADAGLFIDHANAKPGHYADTWLSESEIRLLQRSGIPYDVLVDDWDTYYNGLPRMSRSEMDAAVRRSAGLYNVSHSIYGSMGGYLTYNEVVTKLDSMRLEYPDLISQKFSIGVTLEGRFMWAVRITKNPDIPSGRPEVLYHALIHAREPESMETQMYYFYWLFENYGTDPLATYILENREIYWVPVFNPDGYVYNQTTNPNGGGMWRANRHNNGNNCGWVDLNRNFGIYQFWNSSNGGSSTDPCSGGSGTYRGTTPFSERETQAIMNFVAARNFNAAFGAHTYGNYLIKPWAWSDPQVTPDDHKFNQYLADMKASNPVYTTGTPSQTVGYFVRGGADDWYYEDSLHAGHHIIAITPETGTSFWPPQSQILPLAQGMLFNNQYVSLIAGSFVNPLSAAFNQPAYTAGQAGTFKVVWRNKGVMNAANVSVEWTSAHGGITIPVSQHLSPSMPSFATDSATFDFTISGSVANNTALPTQLTIRIDTTTLYSSTAYVLIGNGTIVLSDSGNVFSNWTTNGTWGMTSSQYSSPPSSFTDSPGGNYGNNADNSMTLASPLNAATYPVLNLGFSHKYATEAGYDFCNVEVSSDNGTTWQPVASFDGTQSVWTQKSYDLSSYANGSSQTKIRFRLTSDVALTADGWYVDDVRVRGYALSQPPDTGIIVRPGAFTFNGKTGQRLRDSLSIKNATNSPLTIAITESTVTASAVQARLAGTGEACTFASLLQRLRPAFERAALTSSTFQTGGRVPDSPEAYTTILTDERGENGAGAADIYRVQYQYRPGAVGGYHDFRIVMKDLPDTNVIIVLSIDTDQDFGTGRFPTPLGAGPASRDIGSEREILIDASGLIIDSLTSFGRIPAGVVVSTENDTLTLVGLPFLLTIQRDSVLTIGTGTPLGGISVSSLADPDGKMNFGLVASRISRNANPLPDYAPQIGHANIGGETGVSWLSETPSLLTLASNDSAVVSVTALAAKPAGTYRANIALTSAGRPAVTVPVTMNVSTPPNPVIQVAPPSISDTLAIGDSVMHTISIHNGGGGMLTFAILDTTGAPWMSINPVAGSLDSNVTTLASLQVRSAGLAADTTYRRILLVISNDPNAPVFPVEYALRTRTVTTADTRNQLPASFALHQNFPNPFNPETNISFDVPKCSFVTLKIFNLIGQETGTVVSAQLEAGSYNYKVGMERYGLSSGVYFYRLQAGDFVATKKLVLLK